MTTAHLERRAHIYLNALDADPVEVQDLQVAVSAPIRAVLDASTPDVRLVRANITPDGLVLRPGGEEALVSQELASDGLEGEFLLEVTARKIVPPSGPLVVDLYGAGYDPDDAQLLVQPSEMIEADYRTIRRAVRLSGVPEPVFLRAYLLGTGVVEVHRVTLSARNETPLVTFGRTDTLRACGNVAIDDATVRLAKPGEVEFPFHLPRRPVTLLIGFADSTPARGMSVALSAGAVHVRRQIEPIRQRYSETFAIPSDAETVQLALHPVAHQPVELRVAALRDPCALRDYRVARKLSDGLVQYRNHEALPRVYAPRRLRGVKDLAAARDQLRDSRDFVPGEVALVETDEPLEEILAPAMVDESYFGDEQVLVNVRAPEGETFVVINDHFDENWVATVDDQPTPILRTNGLVRGVRVPRGEHTVRLWIRAPLSLWVGAAAALLGLLLAVSVMPWAHRRLWRSSLTPE